MSARKRYRAKNVSAKDVSVMLSSGEWQRDPSQQAEIYRGTEGRVLFVAGGSGTVFESGAEFEELYGALKALPRATSAVDGKWTSKAPEDIPGLVERLRNALSVDGDRLDCSI